MNETPINGRYEDDQAISLMARDQYVREVAWIQALEPLTSQEEEKLFGYLRRAKDEPENAWAARRAQYARERLVEAYQPVVMAVARRYVGCFQSMEWLDLVNEGNAELLATLDEYVQDPAYRGHFRGLVAVKVRQALWYARYRGDGPFRLPDWVASLISRMRRVMAQADAVLSVHQLAEVLGVSEDQVLEAKAALARHQTVSLEGLIDEEEDAEDRHHFVSLFQSEVAAQEARQVELSEAFRRALHHELSEGERGVVELRYGVQEGKTACRSTSLVAEMLAMSPETVSSLDRRARGRLRQVLDPSGVSDQQGCEVQAASDAFYTGCEVATLLGVSSHTVMRYAREGRLPVVALTCRFRGRSLKQVFPKSAVDALARERASLARKAVGA